MSTNPITLELFISEAMNTFKEINSSDFSEVIYSLFEVACSFKVKFI